jgi:glycosyltransferase involved in cell wall biosynthesis
MKIALCLLTFNEIFGCKKDVPSINFDLFDEVFALDGGSQDGTIEYLESQNIIVYQQEKRGYNNACIEAFKKCRSDVLVFFHPKGSINPNELHKFRSFFEDGYDLVIASRMIKGASNEEDNRWLKLRKWMTLSGSLIIALIWRREGNVIWDVIHGMRGMKVDSFFAIKPIPSGISMDLEIVIGSYKRGYKRIEFPVQEKPNLEGRQSHFKTWPTFSKLGKYLIYELLFRKDNRY